jgi:hypothetical protein
MAKGAAVTGETFPTDRIIAEAFEYIMCTSVATWGNWMGEFLTASDDSML